MSANPQLADALDLADQCKSWRALDDSEMVLVRGGPFLSGVDRHDASLPAFAMGVHPITNRQWQRFLAETSYVPAASHPQPERYLAHWDEGVCPERLLDHPVVNISRFDVDHYCAWAQLSIPTVLQWEKAARGVDGRTYPWGEMSPFGGWKVPPLAHVGQKSTAAVGSYAHVRSAWGCQDMIGNVSELCLIDAVDDGRTDGAQILCCGSAYLRLRNHAGRMTCAHSRALRASARNRWLGFRPLLAFGG